MSGLLAHRYRVVGPLPPVGGVPRDLAVDITTDGRVELARFAAGGEVPPAFEETARRYQACRHACLAPVLEIAAPPAGEGSPVVVEGHADGPRLDPSGRLPLPTALLAVADVADALATLHAAGLVHGALGFEAIVIDAVGRPVVVGAGSRQLQSLALASPEPAQTADDDVRAVGGVLYALVCGRAPDPVPLAPSSLTPGLEPALNGLILAMLSDDPLRPPPPAAAIAMRLRDLAGVGVHPALPSVPPLPPLPPGPYPAYAVDEPPRVPRRGYSDAGIIGAGAVLAVAGVLAAYAFTGLDEDARTEAVVSTQVTTVDRVVPVPAANAGSTIPTDGSGIFTVPTDTTPPTDSFPLTLTDIVTQTDPFAIPTIITETETVTVTISGAETTDTVFTDTQFTDTEFTDTTLTDTTSTDTAATDTGTTTG
jgi:hypothetical protein